MKKPEPAPQSGVKTFVLDTNVLLNAASSMLAFADNDVVLPMAVIEELDKFKKDSDTRGLNARQVIRTVDRLRELHRDRPGALRTGLPLKDLGSGASGNLLVHFSSRENVSVAKEVDSVFGSELSLESPDNRILRTCCELRNDGRKVIFITKDLNLRLKADALGLPVMDFEMNYSKRGPLERPKSYTGFQCRKVAGALVDKAKKDGYIPASGFSYISNEFIVLEDEKDENHTAIVRGSSDAKTLAVISPSREKVWNISARNREQLMAFDLLLDPKVKLVSLSGGAGTGKTLLALAAALQLVLKENRYERILVSRPIIPMGNDLGFMPGDKDAKLTHWMQPIFDNLSLLLDWLPEELQTPGKKNKNQISAESMIKSGQLALEALTYIRGRSISRQLLIVDEAQNLSPHEIKTIISRCGDDTKMILTGDPAQIDNPYLDAMSNGITYAAVRLKGQDIYGHVVLGRSERSALAALANKLL